MAGGAEVALQVDADDVVPLLLRHREDHPVAQDAGVVHEHVELAEGVDGLLHHGAGLLEVGDVGAVHHGLAAHRLDLGDHLVGRARVGAAAVGLGAEVVDDHRRALAGQHQRVLAPDAAAGAVTIATRPSQIPTRCPLELVSDSHVTLVTSPSACSPDPCTPGPSLMASVSGAIGDVTAAPASARGRGDADRTSIAMTHASCPTSGTDAERERAATVTSRRRVATRRATHGRRGEPGRSMLVAPDAWPPAACLVPRGARAARRRLKKRHARPARSRALTWSDLGRS